MQVIRKTQDPRLKKEIMHISKKNGRTATLALGMAFALGMAGCTNSGEAGSSATTDTGKKA